MLRLAGRMVAVGVVVGTFAACWPDTSQRRRAASARPSRQSQSLPERPETSVDQAVLAWLASNPPSRTTVLTDVLPGESFRLDVERDPGNAAWDRLRIDRDRDGNADEKWTLSEGRPVKRRVSTHDDASYDREDRWRDGRWVRKRGAW